CFKTSCYNSCGGFKTEPAFERIYLAVFAHILQKAEFRPTEYLYPFGVKIIKISRKDDTWSVYLICFYQNFICVLGHIDSFKTVRIYNLLERYRIMIGHTAKSFQH